MVQLMRRAAVAFSLALVALPAQAASIPVFEEPNALLEAIYHQYDLYGATDDYDPADYFEDEEAYSLKLTALLDSANEKFWAAGNEMGALDFSPFISGQDTGGLDYVVHDAKIKGSRAVTDVDILLEGAPLHTITFHFVHEGAERGWKVDDVLLPNGDSEGSWPLSEYLADPFIP
ncbi:MAG: hypothetical protein EOP20_01335 [Hyphomicrobiales bacterium]|nr:MAG: hypothetical protein EOP20_01335 [Hyphomicrobiales bacterium]